MPAHPQPDPPDDAGLDAAVEQAIAACSGDLRATIRALIVANNYLENEVAELMKAVMPIRGGDSIPTPADRGAGSGELAASRRNGRRH
jgi:hypothetical protein